MKYYNYQTVREKIIPGGSISSKSTKSYSADSSATKRNSRYREFNSAIACIKSGSQGTFTIKLVLVSGGADYQMDEVVLTAGESATWTNAEYGIELAPGDTVKLEFTAVNSTGSDRLYFFIRTRDAI